MKRILGLDLGTNSIGWALVKHDFNQKEGEIIGSGSRIIPMSQDILGNFDAGNSISQTAERTRYRGIRRLRERHLLRRERLHRVLNVLGFLPEHYKRNIDFVKRKGKFNPGTEPKVAHYFDSLGEFHFLFLESFNEMLNDFKKAQPSLFENVTGSSTFKVPYDWTIYYLRKKGLYSKLTNEELSWLILNFNQKRGYYQLRGEEEDDNPGKKVEFHSLKVVDVIADEKVNTKGETWYSLQLENGWVYRRSSKISLSDWNGKVKDFIVTTALNADGTIKVDKEGNESRTFRAPSEDDWTLLKKKTEADLEKSNMTVGEYIYASLLIDPKQKIRGKLIRTIERRYYKAELEAILKKQIELQPEIFTKEAYTNCIEELYSSNQLHQDILSKRNFVHLLVNDIIFYQRPLRSQKSLISNCALEYREYKKEGIVMRDYLKAIHKSNPLYQEFRLWQWLYNLRIYRRDDDVDVTGMYLFSVEDKHSLFNSLNSRKDIDQKTLLKYFKLSDKHYRWNFVEDKTYPCNETRTKILSRLEKVAGYTSNLLTSEVEYHLWHLVYSISDIVEFRKALASFARKYQLDEVSFVEHFQKFPPFKSEYGTYSEKAIKKLLPLMRLGSYWNWDDIDSNAQERIFKIISGEVDEQIKDRVREKAISLTQADHFQGLQLWLAQYIVYGRHSEAELTGKWNTVGDLEKFLNDFKQHSLRNPIVEQVVTETLRVIKDIWVIYGKGESDYFDEIHIELGREMKNTADQRKKMTEKISENENTNQRIKCLLSELQEDPGVENVRPYSPVQQEILKIYEEGVIKSGIEVPDEILKISKTAQPSSSDLKRYKLWLEQKYRSPYTGAIIPLGKLFTTAYEIEHIIPQSRYFDDSISNKVICEAEVNKLKSSQLALEFVKKHHGQIVETGFGSTVKIFDEEEYTNFIKKQYASNYSKKTKLLLDEIPDKMIERQINDTRYISKYIGALLSNLVRETNNDDGVNSKNIVSVTGKITSILKQDWGLNDVWNDLILSRFERMNVLTDSNAFTSWNPTHQKFLPTVPIEFAKGFQKKRIDHRHHALDAMVVACVTRDHINLLNNKEANTTNVRYDLQRKLRRFEKVSYKDHKTGNQITKDLPKDFIQPWHTFTVDVREMLMSITISFKQNLRIINKTTNKYERFVQKDGQLVKSKDVQRKGDSWAIRKPLHKDTIFGEVALRKIKEVKLSEALKDWRMLVDKTLKKEIIRLIADYGGKFDHKLIVKYFKDRKNQFEGIDISRVEIYYFENNLAAVRKPLDISFNEKKIKESITDTGIQKILLKYLTFKDSKPEVAFTPEGIDEMNASITKFNEGRYHQPILKVRVYEPMGSKFVVGEKANNNRKFVEAAKGTNLFFAIYCDEQGKRSYQTIPLNVVVERLKQGLSEVPECNSKGDKLLFHLSPNDLVYVPTEEEILEDKAFERSSIRQERIYKMVSSSGSQCFFVNHTISISIVNKVEFSALNKMERTISGEMIKDCCIKLNVNRLGHMQL